MSCYEDEFEGLSCAECNSKLTEVTGAIPDGEGWLCPSCYERMRENEEEAAEKFARENCMITQPFPKCDPALEFRCSPEDYEVGAKESYTPSSYRAKCRHECTNYDKLCKDLRGCDEHGIRHLAIHARIRELVEEEIRRTQDEEALSWLGP